jgi:hypothetical protein
MWRQAHEQLVNAAERGWYSSDANVRCSAQGTLTLFLPHRGRILSCIFISGRYTSREGVHRTGQ